MNVLWALGYLDLGSIRVGVDAGLQRGGQNPPGALPGSSPSSRVSSAHPWVTTPSVAAFVHRRR
jgi:hypothetical protein